MDKKEILEIKNLSKVFDIKSKKLFEKPSKLKAVNDVSFKVYKGETLGIIGESGCGKSTLGKAIIQLSRATEGKIIYQGKDITNLNKRELRGIRKDIQMVFQDPYSSLDPRKTILDLIKEPMIVHNIGSPSERNDRVKELLIEVGLDAMHSTRYPHEFSGGQRQRINVARALALNPKIVVCDEPVSALDVSVQARVLNMMKRVQEKYDLTYIFISHDLGVVKYISDRIAIMYLGKIMEMGNSNEIYENPKHPYTEALFSAIPPDSPLEKQDTIVIEGDIPSPLNLPKGCEFSTRCHKCMDICKDVKPKLKQISDDHYVLCHLY
jgi:oligopeptide/dipeptide ABC transporter ATP-binding protein